MYRSGLVVYYFSITAPCFIFCIKNNIFDFKVIGEGPGFAKEFFTNIKEGLFNERVIATHSESIAVMTAYMECLRYTLFSCADKGDAENEDQRETIEYLINNEVCLLVVPVSNV